MAIERVRRIIGVAMFEEAVAHHKITVHGLWNGAPLCGFINTFPVFWPVGHNYINAHDGAQARNITCEGCKVKARDLKIGSDGDREIIIIGSK